ncbi:MAG: hypothetical protein U1C46_00570 [Bacteroidales bacterium]|nr:hypothetical protein [Bacteroidales bacterium]MDZ4203283.1 hypothetical protein [Bacteroidales bacterium]
MKTALKFTQARLSPSSQGQVATEAAVDTSKEYFEEVLDEYHANRNVCPGHRILFKPCQRQKRDSHQLCAKG